MRDCAGVNPLDGEARRQEGDAGAQRGVVGAAAYDSVVTGLVAIRLPDLEAAPLNELIDSVVGGRQTPSCSCGVGRPGWPSVDQT